MKRIIVNHTQTSNKRAWRTYRDWQESSGYEPAKANPDILSDEPQNRLWGGGEVTVEQEAVRSVFTRLLDHEEHMHFTKQQSAVFRICIIGEQSEKQAASILTLSQQRISQLKLSVLRKLKKLITQEIERSQK